MFLIFSLSTANYNDRGFKNSEEELIWSLINELRFVYEGCDVFVLQLRKYLLNS